MEPTTSFNQESQATESSLNCPFSKKRTFSSKKIYRVGICNVRTMSDPTTLTQITQIMNRYQMDILGLCVTRWNGNGEFHTKAGFHLLFSGKPVDQNHTHGV